MLKYGLQKFIVGDRLDQNQYEILSTKFIYFTLKSILETKAFTRCRASLSDKWCLIAAAITVSAESAECDVTPLVFVTSVTQEIVN